MEFRNVVRRGVRIWFLAALAFAPGWIPAGASGLDVKVVTVCCQFEQVVPDQPKMTSIDRRLFEHGGALNVSVEYTNFTRALRYVQEHENVCTTRIRKTPAREEIFHFSALPHSVYPPFRLITLTSEKMRFGADVIDLDKLLAQHDLLIGVLAKTDYGSVVAAAKTAYPEKFFEVPTSRVEEEMMVKALLAGRVDALIADGWTTEVYRKGLQEKGEAWIGSEGLTHFPLVGIEPNFGHIACSKTPAGLRILEQINATLANPAYLNTLLQVHLDWFPPDDAPFLKRTFKATFDLKSEPFAGP